MISPHAKPCTVGFPSRSRLRAAFSLVELLVVIGIIIALGGISTAAFNNIARSTQLSTAAQGLSEQFNMARQTALTRQQRVAFCFYSYSEGKTGGSNDFRAVQWFVWDNTKADPADPSKGWTAVATNTWFMPPSTILNSDTRYSNLLTDTDPGSTAGSPLPPKSLTDANSSVTMRWFSFLPDGSTTLASEQTWFVTMQPRNDSTSGGVIAGLPPNFVTIGVDPVTGRFTVYRP